jgi:2-keto-3-deoxy-L-rhamnonate aldolase RhmA
MLELIQITNDPAFARRCDALEGMRVWVDLERMGKAERQAGRDTFISRHVIDDVARVRDVLRRTRLMVRVNPLHPGSAEEIDAVLAQGADQLMLPMFGGSADLQAFSRLVGARVPFTALLETPGALDTVADWAATPGLQEIYVGLNDLHLALGHRFMFEALALGLVDRVAEVAHRAGRRFGFGGIARLDEGLLPGRDVLAEHLRLGSQAVILSRTFHRPDIADSFEAQVAALRQAEAELAARDADSIEGDRVRIANAIRVLARDLPPRA